MTKKEIKKLILVDGSSYLFRAYHALPPLTNSKNIPTGAVYGVINMLKKLIGSEVPDFVGVVFDAKGRNFRHEIYSEYKANRAAMPEELAVQIKPLHDIIRAMGLPLIIIKGVEADDVIGTLAVEAARKNIQVLISTGDKDMAQLVGPNVALINTMTGKYMDREGVVEKFGVRAEQMIDYLALVGDTSDNIPGVSKVGPKTAQKWLMAYDSIENLLNHQDEITGKVGENLRSHVAFIPVAKDLVTIRTNVKVKLQTNNLLPKAADKEALALLFAEMEFKTWQRDLSSSDLGSTVEKKYDIVTTDKDLNKWLQKIEKATLISFDTETTGLNPHMADLVGVSLSASLGEACYIPLGHNYDGCPVQLDKSTVLAKLKPMLNNSNIQKVGQNIKYDMHVLVREKMDIFPVSHDTMVASYCLHSTQTRHGMDSLARFYLGVETTHFEDVAGKGAKQISFAQVTIENAASYAAEDADITLRLHHKLQSELNLNKQLKKLYEEIEMPLVEVLFHMEQAGVCLDKQMLEGQSAHLAKRLAVLESDVHAMAGEAFNLGSPKQLQEILFAKLAMPVLLKTPKGAPSTSEAALQALGERYELPILILEHRSLSKLKSTYTDKLPQLINPHSQRIHTSYHQAVTATGRLSSSDPNLQNIPIRTEEGRKIRQAFIAPPGKKLISADYSQIELRIMAHLSQDKGLLAAFKEEQDIHKFTASEIFSVALDDVTFEQRRSAKAINFGLIYGMSVFGLAKQLDVDQAAAKAYMAMYFKRYPGVKDYMENIRQTAFEQGYVETLLGRRLYLPEIRSKQVPRRKAAERTAINAPMQGTAADLIKIAMIHIFERIKDSTDITMLMQVHDELVFEVVESAVEGAQALIKSCMENCLPLSVPLLVDIGVGDNWAQAH